MHVYRPYLSAFRYEMSVSDHAAVHRHDEIVAGSIDRVSRRSVVLLGPRGDLFFVVRVRSERTDGRDVEAQDIGRVVR